MDGVEALQLFEEGEDEIDMAIIDLIMPNLGGRETFLRMREISPALPVLISTGFSPDGHAAEIMNHERTGFLKKPFHMEEMLRMVRMALDGE